MRSNEERRRGREEAKIEKKEKSGTRKGFFLQNGC
jgi:hypothetical protein